MKLAIENIAPQIECRQSIVCSGANSNRIIWDIRYKASRWSTRFLMLWGMDSWLAGNLLHNYVPLGAEPIAYSHDYNKL